MTGFALEIVEPNLAPRTVKVTKSCELGREAAIVVNDASVSRRHVRLDLENGQLRATDLGSTHGTLLNGARLEGAVVLTSGDVLQVGNSRVRITAEGAGRQSQATMALSQENLSEMVHQARSQAPAPMPSCPQGHQNPSGLSFCRTCGMPLSYAQPPLGGAAQSAFPPTAPYAQFPSSVQLPKSSYATVSVVFGIIGLLICGPIMGIVAIALAVMAKSEIDAGRAQGNPSTGLILGIVDLVVGGAMFWYYLSQPY